MTWHQRRRIPQGKECRHCGVKWGQGRLMLCAICRAIIREQSVQAERAATALRLADARRRLQLEARERAADSRMVPRTVRVGGQEFDVVWDGT